LAIVFRHARLEVILEEAVRGPAIAPDGARIDDAKRPRGFAARSGAGGEVGMEVFGIRLERDGGVRVGLIVWSFGLNDGVEDVLCALEVVLAELRVF